MTPLESPKKLWKSMTAADRILSGSILAASLVWAVGARSPERGAVAIVMLGNEEHARIPLDRDALVPLHGTLGEIDLEVRGGAISVVRSECPNHVCIAMGQKRNAGDVLACVPNALVVRVEGGARRHSAPDAIAR
jgi:hypothetical protein